MENAKATYISDDAETLSPESDKGDFGAENGQQLVSQGVSATSQDIITNPNELLLCSLPMKTNLKIEQVSPHTCLTTRHPVQIFTGQLHYELPNNSLYTFEGTLELCNPNSSAKATPLGPDQVLLRGAQLRNTPFCYGLVVYTGHETKLMWASITLILPI
ncbi:hypothetical protein M422DRAFT_242240 [Sphaerobolus stellatus SS14]|nr:hypothetical protein M422DRAFT_242240 [Sphaerobolus stellatus SS14]